VRRGGVVGFVGIGAWLGWCGFEYGLRLEEPPNLERMDGIMGAGL
jgi:hypothetical protein